MPPPDPAPQSLKARLLWFVGLWLAGITTVTLISLLLRFWIAPHR